MLIGLAAIALTSLWLGGTTSLPAFLVASLLAGAGTGLVSPATNAAVADVISTGGRPDGSGSALAAFQLVGDLGAVVGPLLAGLVVEIGGYPAAFAVTALLAAPAFGWWLRSPETGPGSSQQTEGEQV